MTFKEPGLLVGLFIVCSKIWFRGGIAPRRLIKKLSVTVKIVS